MWQTGRFGFDVWICLAFLHAFASPPDGHESQIQTIQQHSVPSARWRPGTRSGKSVAIEDSVFLSWLQLSIKQSKCHVTSLGVSATTRFSVHNLKLKQSAPCTHSHTRLACSVTCLLFCPLHPCPCVYCKQSFNLNSLCAINRLQGRCVSASHQTFMQAHRVDLKTSRPSNEPVYIFFESDSHPTLADSASSRYRANTAVIEAAEAKVGRACTRDTHRSLTCTSCRCGSSTQETETREPQRECKGAGSRRSSPARSCLPGPCFWVGEDMQQRVCLLPSGCGSCFWPKVTGEATAEQLRRRVKLWGFRQFSVKCALQWHTTQSSL